MHHHVAGALAHPVVEADLLPIAPLAAAAIGVLIVIVVARFAPAWSPGRPPVATLPSPARLTAPERMGRTVGVATLALVVAVGQFGPLAPARNLAPVLVLGVGWPLLVAATLLLGQVWRVCDPFDGLARSVRAPAVGGLVPEGRAGVHADGAPPAWLAVLPAVALTWYVAAYPDALAPRRLSLALALYTILTIAACLAFGRVWWLARGEVIGRAFAWLGLFPRGGLVTWRPPGGAPVVVGVLTGGLLFRALRLSSLWAPAVFALPGGPAAVLGLLGCAVAGAGLLVTFESWARRRGAGGMATAAAVPTAAGIALASSLAGAHSLLALWLLPGVLLDPLGRGWAPEGLGRAGLDTLPVGASGLALVQLSILLAGAMGGALVVRARAGQSRRGAAAGVLAVAVPFAAAAVVVTVA